MAKPVLHGPGFSTYVRTARLALAEKGIDYDLNEFNFIADGVPADHLARNPFGKVPAFSHGDFEVYETVAIARYIDEAFEGPALQPADAAGRARVTQASAIIDSYAYPSAITGVVIQRVVVPMMGGEADEAVIAEALPKAAQALGVLNAMIGDRAHLVGDALSLADLHLVPVYDYFRQTPDGQGVLADMSGLQRWWDGIAARPSVTATTPQLG